MKIEFIVILEDKPGRLADLGDALGDADINVEAMMGFAGEEDYFVHMVVDEPKKAEKLLEREGLMFSTREVITVDLLDQPGTLGDVARVMGDANINIESIYVTVGGTVVMAMDDVDGAEQITQGMAVRRL